MDGYQRSDRSKPGASEYFSKSGEWTWMWASTSLSRTSMVNDLLTSFLGHFRSCHVSEVRYIKRMGVFQGVTLTLALSHDGRGDFHALICSMNL